MPPTAPPRSIAIETTAQARERGSANPSESAGDQREIYAEFRIVWGSRFARSFQGEISISNGSISFVRNLSLQPDSIGKIYERRDDAIGIEPFSRTTFGGGDFIIHGAADAEVRFAFFDSTRSEMKTHTAKLSELMDGSWVQDLDEQGGRIAVQRQPHDRFRVLSKVPQSIFDVGSQWDFQISGYRCGLTPGDYKLEVILRGDDATTSPVLSKSVQIDSTGSFAPQAISLTIPNTEGVYALELRVESARRLPNLLPNASSPVRRIEFLAFDSQAATLEVIGWEPIRAINSLDASQPGALAWLSPVTTASAIAVPESWQQFNPLSGQLQRSISHGELSEHSVSIPTDDSVETLRCLSMEPDAWLAIPAINLKSDVPHKLKIRIPSDAPADLAVSVKPFPRNLGSPASRVAPQTLGNDYRIVLSQRECTREGSLVEYEILFWPASDGNVLFLANADKTQDARVFDVRIDEARMALSQRDIPNLGELDLGSSVAKLVSAKNDAVKNSERLIGIYLDKPLLSECFADARIDDPVAGRRLESWHTWQTASLRLIQFSKWSGANLLVAKIQADGGAIFPSEALQPSPRYDGGIFFSDSRSPDTKDAVALLLRHCERAGMRLIVALDMDAPLPALRLSDSNSSQSSLLQRRDDGQLSRSMNYNPLDSQVQRELLRSVEEIVNRYGDSPAFAGVQLQIDRNSQFVFSGDRWGFNEQNLSAFQKQTGRTLDLSRAANSSALDAAREDFQQWRSAELSKLFQAAGRLVSSANADAKLYLNATRMWETAPTAEDFLKPELASRDPSYLLLALGLNLPQLRQLPSVNFMHGRFHEDRETVDPEDWLREIAQERGLATEANSRPNESQMQSTALSSAAVIVQQPSSFRLANFDTFNAATSSSISDTLYPLNIGQTESQRRLLVSQLYQDDHTVISSGAWLPLATNSPRLDELRRTLRALPPKTMTDFPIDAASNMRFRSLQVDGKLFVQVVNNSPWPEQVAFAIQTSNQRSTPTDVTPPDDRLSVLGQREVELQLRHPPPTSQMPTGQEATGAAIRTWQFEINAYDVIGFRYDDDTARLTDVAHSPGDEVLAQISTELSAIEAVITAAADPTRQTQLANLFGDFEQWNDDGSPRNWNVSSLPRTQISRSNDLPHSGKSSLKIQNANPGNASAWIQSLPFEVPETGRLSVHAWLRTPPTDRTAKVKVSVSGRHRNGERFERSQQFNANAANHRIANDWGTRPATLDVSDLPVNEIDKLIVSIELLGSGTVWVDDVQVYKSWLHPQERVYLQGSMLVAKQKLNAKNPFPAEQLLDSHWGRYLTDSHPIFADRDEFMARSAGSSTNSQTRREKSRKGWNSSPSLFQQLRESMRERWRR